METAEHSYCIYCGAALALGQKFCVPCGQRMGAGEIAVSQGPVAAAAAGSPGPFEKPRPLSQKLKEWLATKRGKWILICCAALLVVGIVAAVLAPALGQPMKRELENYIRSDSAEEVWPAEKFERVAKLIPESAQVVYEDDALQVTGGGKRQYVLDALDKALKEIEPPAIKMYDNEFTRMQLAENQVQVFVALMLNNDFDLSTIAGFDWTRYVNGAYLLHHDIWAFLAAADEASGGEREKYINLIQKELPKRHDFSVLSLQCYYREHFPLLATKLGWEYNYGDDIIELIASSYEPEQDKTKLKWDELDVAMDSPGYFGPLLKPRTLLFVTEEWEGRLTSDMLGALEEEANVTVAEYPRTAGYLLTYDQKYVFYANYTEKSPPYLLSSVYTLQITYTLTDLVAGEAVSTKSFKRNPPNTLSSSVTNWSWSMGEDECKALCSWVKSNIE